MLYFILVSYFLTLGLLSLYSYSQVDSNLILANLPLSSLLRTLADFGTYDRLASGTVFGSVLILLFIDYLCLLAQAKQLSKGFICTLIAGSVVLTLPAFPAFLSHDIYSYIFDAKILAFYHELPWLTSPSHFQADLWLALDYWPTSASRYGPVWIGLTGFLYQLGRGNLISIMFIFKFLGVFSFLGIAVLIWKLATKLKIDPKQALVFFAVNPLIVIDGLVNLHTDIFMSFFVLSGLYLLLKGRKVAGYISLAVATLGVKIVSLPFLVVPLVNKIPLRVAFLLLAYLGSVVIIARWSINPWYFLSPIILTALVWEIKFWRYLAINLSLAALARYLPYLYWGFFDPNNKIRATIFLVLMLPFGLWTIFNFVTKPRKLWFEEIFGAA